MKLRSKAINSFFKILYMPLCRLYAKHVLGNKPADTLYCWLCSLQFIRTHHFWPNFRQPERFTEKIWHKMLFDRSPQLTLLNDKLLVRDFVKSKIGSECLIPLLWKGNNPELIPFTELPSKFVIKTNHGCAYNIIVKNKTEVNEREIKKQLAQWLKTNYCDDFLIGIEWGYKNIKPYIIIESFIGATDKAPEDYKFYCFSGHVEFVTVHFDRFTEHKTLSFDRDFMPHEFTYDFAKWRGEFRGEIKRPSNFESMVQIAESLAVDFDFMRVDLYNVNNRIYFGELTPYPGGVSTRFLPISQDYKLGKKWKINK